MSDRMHPMSFAELMARVLKGYKKTGSGGTRGGGLPALCRVPAGGGISRRVGSDPGDSGPDERKGDAGDF